MILILISDSLRICFKFEEEDAEKDSEAMKKERFEAVMGMMQVTRFKTLYLFSPLLPPPLSADGKMRRAKVYF